MTKIPDNPADCHRVACPYCQRRITVDVTPKASILVGKDTTYHVDPLTGDVWRIPPAPPEPRPASPKGSWSHAPSPLGFDAWENPYYTSVFGITNTDPIQLLNWLHGEVNLLRKRLDDEADKTRKRLGALDASLVAAHKRISHNCEESNKTLRETIGDFNTRLEATKATLRREMNDLPQVTALRAENDLLRQKIDELISHNAKPAHPPENPSTKPQIPKDIVADIRANVLKAMIEYPTGSVSFTLTAEMYEAIDKAIESTLQSHTVELLD